MESHPQNPEFRNNPETLELSRKSYLAICASFSSFERGLTSSVDSEKLECWVLAAWNWTASSLRNNLPHLHITGLEKQIFSA